jgi:hypoxanthine phosphoribosyltransferase
MGYKINPYITEDVLNAKVKELAQQISADYKGKDLLMVSVLKGAVVFLTDLMRAVDDDVAVSIDFMVVSSYGAGTASSGEVKIVKDLSVDIAGKDVLIVEDILDSGNTLSKLVKILKERGVNSLKIAALLDKPSRHVTEVPVDYTGFVIPDEFVVGYGLDYGEKHRNLPYVGTVEFIED